MKWSNVAAWLLSIASLAFAAHPTLAKDLDKQVPKGARPIARVVKPVASGNQVAAAIAPGASAPANFTVSKVAFNYQNTTAISGTNGLLANALWGSITTAGLNQSAPKSFNPLVQGEK